MSDAHFNLTPSAPSNKPKLNVVTLVMLALSTLLNVLGGSGVIPPITGAPAITCPQGE